jgi:hypothetical protein
VGYINNIVLPGYNPFTVQLDGVDGNGYTNSVTNIFPNPLNNTIGNGPLDSSTLYTWTGTAFHATFFDANPADVPAGQSFTGITDSGGNFIQIPPLTNGEAVYLSFAAVPGFGNNYTNTIVGAVRGVQTGYISNNVVIPILPVHSLVGSGLPIGGGVMTGLLFTNVNVFNPGVGNGPLDGDEIQIPKYNGIGILTGYTSYYFDSNPADVPAGQSFTGITDSGGNFLPEPQVPVGSGFIFLNNNGTVVNWTQVLQLQ